MKLKLSSFSAYARPESHLTQQTFHGAAVTLCGVALALYLFIHETNQFWKLHTTTQMSVDLARRHDLPVYIDISFPAVPCAVLSMDVLDVSGTSEHDASFAKDMEIHKIRLDAQGRKVGKAEYYTPQSQQILEDGAGGAVMNVNVPLAMKHLEEMEEEAEKHEGCHLTGKLLVHRVAGRIHFSVHQQVVFQVLPQLLGGHRIPKVLNMSHHIEQVSFGPPFPGQVNPLDGFTRTVSGQPQAFKYFLKVVPTQYFSRFASVTETHQYSVSEYQTAVPSDGSNPPAVDFMYDMSPILVTVNAKPPSMLHYLVRISAVVGGVFAVTRMMDRHVHWLVSLLTKSG